MNKKKCYLAGKMTGLPYFGFPEFFKYEEQLKEQGWEVFNPARHDVERYGEFYKDCPNGTHEEMEKAIWPSVSPGYREFMKADLNWILDNADAIALMPNWSQSRGAIVEKGLAELIGLEVINL